MSSIGIFVRGLQKAVNIYSSKKLVPATVGFQPQINNNYRMVGNPSISPDNPIRFKAQNLKQDLDVKFSQVNNIKDALTEIDGVLKKNYQDDYEFIVLSKEGENYKIMDIKESLDSLNNWKVIGDKRDVQKHLKSYIGFTQYLLGQESKNFGYIFLPSKYKEQPIDNKSKGLFEVIIKDTVGEQIEKYVGISSIEEAIKNSQSSPSIKKSIKGDNRSIDTDPF